jgi:guanine deaminase
VAGEFLTGLISAGTTSAMVFGSHFAGAMDIFFSAAARAGLRVTSGLVTSDRNLPESLLTDVDRSIAEGQALIDAWHGKGRLRYAVTPRFSFSAGPELLAAGGALVAANPGIWVTSHLNENLDESPGSPRSTPRRSTTSTPTTGRDCSGGAPCSHTMSTRRIGS